MTDACPSVVYQATCKVNGKRYIGFTSKGVLRRRQWHFAEAKGGSTTNFHKAIGISDGDR